VGSILSLLGMLLFAAIVYTRVGVARSLSGSAEPVGAAD
jgi:hypothetical protein